MMCNIMDGDSSSSMQVGASPYNLQCRWASVLFHGKQKGKQGKAQHHDIDSPTWKMQELLISGNNGILGNKWEQPSIPLHTTFTVTETTCWFITLLHQQDRTGKNTKCKSTNNLQPLLTGPNNTSHARSLKKAQEGPEQSLAQPLTWGKELNLQAARFVF